MSFDRSVVYPLVRAGYRSLFLFTIFIGILFSAAQTAIAQEDRVLERALISSSQQKLAQDPQWRALLHYAPRFASLSSPTRISGGDFFISKDGFRNPEAELDATIRAFVASDALNDEHAQCRFPARYQWLRGKLASEFSAFPTIACARYQTWLNALAPAAITLVFPASFLNNPASAFGHTFLRLDQKDQNEQTRLLSYAADYAAQTDGEGAIVYATKGIFGGFQGFYSVAPYHKKVDKYSDLENRDIWEYQLSLTAEEVGLLTAHLWELRDIPHTYYYFDENCSYHILSLLDVARPSLKLAQRFDFWVMPVDTVRIIHETPGLVCGEVFRPSAATKLRGRITAASSEVSKYAQALLRNDSAAQSAHKLSDRQRADALDIAYEYNTYQRIRSRSDDPISQNRAFELLKLRSKIPLSTARQVETPAARPDQGHRTAMTSIGIGRLEDKGVVEMQLRPALHALSDRPTGYLPGNQIKFFDAVVRLTEEQGIDVARFTALDIVALTPRDDFFTPISWRINLNGSRFRFANGSYPFGYSLNGGAGVTYQLTDRLLSYGMIEADLKLFNQLNEGHAIGLGPAFGSIYLPNEWLGFEAKVSRNYYLLGDTFQYQQISLTPRMSLSKNTAIRVESSFQDSFNRSSWSNLLKFEYFFTP